MTPVVLNNLKSEYKVLIYLKLISSWFNQKQYAEDIWLNISVIHKGLYVDLIHNIIRSKRCFKVHIWPKIQCLYHRYFKENKSSNIYRFICKYSPTWFVLKVQ